MTNKATTGLTSGSTPLAGTEDLYVVQGGNSRQVNVSDVVSTSLVDAAGAVLNTDSSTAAMSFVVDEDNMVSDLATKVPTQQSVKAYVDNRLVTFDTVALLKADTGLAYSSGSPTVAAGDTISAGAFLYVVAASGATDHHLTTAGSVKLYVAAHSLGFNAEALGVDLTGATAADTEFAAVIDNLPSTGGGIVLPDGLLDFASPIDITAVENFAMRGLSVKSSRIQVSHSGIGLDVESVTKNLPDGKYVFDDFAILDGNGNTVDGDGFPTASFVGTGMRLKETYSASHKNLYFHMLGTGLELDSSFLLTFVSPTFRNCWHGITCTNTSGKVTGITIIGGVFNNSGLDMTNGEKFYIVNTDFEAASNGLEISSRNVFENCRFERMHINRTFFTWLNITGDDNVIRNPLFAWDGATSAPSTNVDEFFIHVDGDRNDIELGYMFSHRQPIRLNSGSEGNTVRFTVPFNDYTNSGGTLAFRYSQRLFTDEGTNNKIIFDYPDGYVETIGAKSLVAHGNLNTYCVYHALENLTINQNSGTDTLVIAASDIQGPFGALATNGNVKKFTINDTGALIRAYSPSVVTADGTKKYCITAYVQIPNVVSPVTKVRIGDGSGNFYDIYPSDGLNVWHRVVMFVEPANTDTVQWMIQAEGDVADFFYVAFPSVNEGLVPCFVDVPPSKTSWTTKFEAKNQTSDKLKLPYGGDETDNGTWSPTLTGVSGTSPTVADSSFTKIGNIVYFQIRITGTGLTTTEGTSTIAVPYGSGDGWCQANNTDNYTNKADGRVLNGAVYLPTLSSTNSFVVHGWYSMNNI